MDPLVQFKEAQKQAWTRFAPLETFTIPAAARLTSHAKVASGQRALDVVCGPGVVAISAARAGANVTGLDLTPQLLMRFLRMLGGLLVAICVFSDFLWGQGLGTQQGTPSLPQKGLCTAPIPYPAQPLNWFDIPSTSASLQEIAFKVAPVMWFSPNEPLVEPLPQNFPTDPMACNDSQRKCRIVYWKPLRIDAACATNRNYTRCSDDLKNLAKDGTKWDLPLNPELIEVLKRIDIIYYFYYPKDIGFASHEHDFESAIIEAGVCKNPGDDQIHVQGVKAAGSAHGVGWYINELDLRPPTPAPNADVLVPPIVLVEEGKHSSAIDRNGDGAWTSGYDANVFPPDAWGTRDKLRSLHFLAMSYHGELARSRAASSLVWPTRSDDPPPKPSTWNLIGPQPVKDLVGEWATYRLRTATDKVCSDIFSATTLPYQKNLLHLTDDDQRMCRRSSVVPADWDPSTTTDSVNRKWTFIRRLAMQSPIGSTWRVWYFRRTTPTEWVSFRSDHGPGFTAITPLGLALPFGWFVTKVNWARVTNNPTGQAGTPISPAGPGKTTHWGFDGMFTRSASRTFDWYVSSGPEKSNAGWRGAAEAGLRVRVVLGEMLPFLRFSHDVERYFFGARVGIRSTFVSGGPGSRDTRLVFEIGGGSW
jgi:hypothetical protein